MCTFLYTSGLIAANPITLVGRPRIAETLPKALPTDCVTALLAVLDTEPQPRRRRDWIERDRSHILTSLLAGLRADELLRTNVGDFRRTDTGAVIHVRGKGGKDRRIPVESPLLEILERYLNDRACRGALVHGLRHTFATELANSDVSVYTLMKLLGHESMTSSQRYVTAAPAPKPAPRPPKTNSTDYSRKQWKPGGCNG